MDAGPGSDDAEEGPEDRADGAADAAGGGSGPDNNARLARLARKAESARLARLRHKQFVQDKQAEVQALQREEVTLLAEEAPATAVALETVRQELRQALTEEQLQVRVHAPRTTTQKKLASFSSSLHPQWTHGTRVLSLSARDVQPTVTSSPHAHRRPPRIPIHGDAPFSPHPLSCFLLSPPLSLAHARILLYHPPPNLYAV